MTSPRIVFLFLTGFQQKIPLCTWTPFLTRLFLFVCLFFCSLVWSFKERKTLNSMYWKLRVLSCFLLTMFFSFVGMFRGGKGLCWKTSIGSQDNGILYLVCWGVYCKGCLHTIFSIKSKNNVHFTWRATFSHRCRWLRWRRWTSFSLRRRTKRNRKP